VGADVGLVVAFVVGFVVEGALVGMVTAVVVVPVAPLNTAPEAANFWLRGDEALLAAAVTAPAMADALIAPAVICCADCPEVMVTVLVNTRTAMNPAARLVILVTGMSIIVTL